MPTAFDILKGVQKGPPSSGGFDQLISRGALTPTKKKEPADLSQEPAQPTTEQPKKPSAFDILKLPKEEGQQDLGEDNEETPSGKKDYNYFTRLGARTLSNLESVVASIPSLAEDFAKGGLDTIRSIGEKFVPEEIAKKAKESEFLVSKDKKFKTTDEFKELNKNIYGKELLEPRDKWEKKIDDVTESFFLQSIPILGGRFRVARPAIAAIGGEVAKELSGIVGMSDSAQSAAKLGASTLAYLVNPRSANNLYNTLYSQAERILPQNATVAAPHLQRMIPQFRRHLERGGSAPSKVESLRKLDEIEGAFVGDRIPVRELTEFKKSINELIANNYSALGISKFGADATLHNLNRVGTAVDRTIARYGNTNRPWNTIYRRANEVYGANSRGEQIRAWLNKQRPGAIKHLGLVQALGHGISPGTAATAVGAELGIRGGALMAKITRSPDLMEMYLNFIRGAAQRNIPLVNRELEKLDKAVSEDGFWEK